MKLRPYSRSDLPFLSAVEAVCFSPPFRFNQETLRELAEGHSSFTWIAEDQDQVVGFAIVELETTSNALRGYLLTIDIAPEYRRRGVASKLLERVEDQIAWAGGIAVRLHVSVQNKPAITMYEHRGYSRLALEERFYGSSGEDAFLYEKLLCLDQPDRP